MNDYYVRTLLRILTLSAGDEVANCHYRKVQGVDEEGGTDPENLSRAGPPNKKMNETRYAGRCNHGLYSKVHRLGIIDKVEVGDRQLSSYFISLDSPTGPPFRVHNLLDSISYYQALQHISQYLFAAMNKALTPRLPNTALYS